MALELEEGLSRLPHVKHTNDVGVLGECGQEVGVVRRGCSKVIERLSIDIKDRVGHHTGNSQQWRRPPARLRWPGWAGVTRTHHCYRECEHPFPFIITIKLYGELTFLSLFCRLVDDSAMLQTSQVKHAHTSISTAADKDIHAVRTKANIIDFLVVSNKLSLSGQGRNVPDSASCVNARCDDKTRGDGVPVKRGDRGSMLGRFRVG